MLGLAQHLPDRISTCFLSFPEDGLGHILLDEAAKAGFRTHLLQSDFPRLMACLRELCGVLKSQCIDLLLCHGYKADLLGHIAARKCGIKHVAVSRGWTGESWKVGLYEALDRRVLRRFDRVVCVSQGQAKKVTAAGVPEKQIVVIRNSIDVRRFPKETSPPRQALLDQFQDPPKFIVGGVGRLSPEKGYDLLLAAAPKVLSQCPDVGFIHFGDGPMAESLRQRTITMNLQHRFVWAGFRRDIDHVFPAFDMMALPSHTEGLPNVVLESFAAGVPVVATAVGGTPEVVQHDLSGLLVPAGDADALAQSIVRLARDESLRARFAQAGFERVQREFTFTAQANSYLDLMSALFDDNANPHQGNDLSSAQSDVGLRESVAS